MIMHRTRRLSVLALAVTLSLSPLMSIADTTVNVTQQPTNNPTTTGKPTTAAPTPNKPAAPVVIPQISINAPSWVLMDYASGNVLAGSNEHDKMAPASLTKIMTAYVVAQAIAEKRIGWNDMVTVSANAAKTGGSRMFLKPNEKVSVQNLMRGMVIESGNDATIALAEHLAGSEEAFVGMMNQTAKQLGLNDTHFVNTSGLPNPEQTSSAYDMAVLSRALIMHFPEEFTMHSEKSFTWNGIKQYNRNKLLWLNPKVDGMKTGYTEDAKYCLVATAKDGDTRMIAVVMGAKSPAVRTAETQKLINFGMRFYETQKLYSANQTIKDLPVWYGKTNSVAVGVANDLLVTTPRAQAGKLQASLNLASELNAPVAVGQTVGSITVSLNGKEVATAPVVALNAVEEGNWWQRLISWLKHLFS
jgi:D-alanyl-D-alanine carboxypeptidase (penicillin-binding protein 5/6)